MSATATSNYIGQAMRATSALAPPSLADNPGLLAWNLFVMTAAMCLGLMMAGKQARRIWAARCIDHPTDPVSVYRIIIFLAGCAIASRGGAEAISLWSWSSGDAGTIQRVSELKRWLDPLSVGCGFVWMALHILAEPMIEHQLRKAPLPVDMWSRWPQLQRPAAVLFVSLLMAAAAVGLR
ncbi:hypothetical protein [Sphingomonas sp. CFBP 8764]|uniref:hypothetical protein n=1 Tax=Sphingomonas sp. CFBP 8764 TaxID=2775275 RepID=UPI00177EEB98|nr:hypothetical protein [Sphingomonas sp. CFBP 8764]MBD8549494.1 hypothetical protein [Sphingomonas sp. CFBP 8764]